MKFYSVQCAEFRVQLIRSTFLLRHTSYILRLTYYVKNLTSYVLRQKSNVLRLTSNNIRHTSYVLNNFEKGKCKKKNVLESLHLPFYFLLFWLSGPETGRAAPSAGLSVRSLLRFSHSLQDSPFRQQSLCGSLVRYVRLQHVR